MKSIMIKLLRNSWSLSLATVFAALLLLPGLASAQQTTSPTDGMRDNTPAVHAFTNATIVTSPDSRITGATMVIRNGVVESVGRNVRIPADARVWDLQGKTIYPGFIDAHSRVGMQDPRVDADERGNTSWNQQLRAHLRADTEFNADDDGSDKLREAGFTTAVSVPTLGIFRGQTAILSLGSGSATDRLIKTGSAQSVSLSRSSEFGFTYPTSPIGAIALIRQTLHDAQWHKQAHEVYQRNPAGLTRPEHNAMLSALQPVVENRQPLLIEANSDEEVLRATRIAAEFDMPFWVRGSGHEYRIADFLQANSVSLILPLNFPDAPDVKAPEDALNENLGSLRHWYLAPENPAILANAGVKFSLTSDGLEHPSHFLSKLRLAIEAGLDPQVALAALTTNPAELLGINATHGTLSAGKSASFIITDGDVFAYGSQILDVWTDGERHVIKRSDVLNPSGTWVVTSSDGSIDGELVVEIPRPGRLNGKITIYGTEVSLSNVNYTDETRRFRADANADDAAGPIRLTASVTADGMQGWAEIAGQGRTQWQASRTNEGAPAAPRERTIPRRDLELTGIRPNMEYGRESLPEQPRNLLIQNATIWTMSDQGTLENADLLIRDGKVVEVGQNIRAPRNATIIDAEGKHVTPGLIDAHLHSGVTGVNEMGNAITAEVRMEDVLTINNIWMYRQLAGGLTTAHVMHGSANAIGGQNVTLKMRWGALSHELPLEGARRTIKFALGENPKRVGSNRYPDTRMGVEQIIADRFRMARDYEHRRQQWESNQVGIPPRRDLRLDALVDILNGDLDVHSHSYRQDEILMLMVLAEEIGFDIKAFHHALEAYKVAPELAERGIGAVVWSDWGGFKIEAYDNTNYNARLLHEAGVVTSLHSDNSDIATRMNWEAAKMVRVGMSPEDALELVTIRTAELLGIDDMVGSLESGKDADFVIWSGDPLSTFTVAEQTWIDGRNYFSLEEDARLQAQNESERNALIKLLLEVKND